MLYFAYGSNLCRRQMEERCPQSKALYRGLLPDFCPAFTKRSLTRGGGVLDIRPAPGDGVWGMVFDITEQDLENLNRCEEFYGFGQSNTYNQIMVTVFKEGERGEPIPNVLTYQVADPDHGHIPPTKEYMHLILVGAEQRTLPLEYRRRLEQFV
jgi:gamma-glutamylcyclotransferase